MTLQLAAPDNLEQRFQALEGDSVDEDLAAMKAGRLKGGNGSKAQLPEGRAYDQVFKKDAIDEVRDDPAHRNVTESPCTILQHAAHLNCVVDGGCSAAAWCHWPSCRWLAASMA